QDRSSTPDSGLASAQVRSRCAVLFTMFLLGAFSLPGSAAVLLVGYGSGNSEEAARAAAQEDLAYRLQRLGARRLQAGAGKVSASVQRALIEGRELPLIRIEVVGA